MERKQNFLQCAMAATGLLVLIFDSRLALEGTRSGVELCVKTVIPSLFPFFVLSMLLTNSLSGEISHPVRILAGLFGIPEQQASLLIPAALGGYPVGAQCIGNLYHQKRVSRKEAERLLMFCSNAGPSFLFGMVSGFFPEKKMIWLLWGIHLISAAFTAAVIPPTGTDLSFSQTEKKPDNTNLISAAAKAMCVVCCWVVLFRTIISFLDAWFLWMLPEWVQVLIIGILELSNGCCNLLLIQNVQLRFVLCSCMLAFGGICVLLQTASVTRELSLGKHIKGKLMQTAFSFLLSMAVVSEQRLIFLLCVPILLLILRKTENRYSNHQILPV